MKRYIAEFVAAFFLVFVATAAIVADQQLAVVQVRETFGTLGIALVQGMALAAVVAAVGRVSGGYGNPAISVAFYVSKRISLKDLGFYVVAQMLGGILAAVMVQQVFPANAVDPVGAGALELAPGTELLQGGLLEVVLTFLLVFVVWGVAVDKRGPKVIAPLAIGSAMTAGVLIGSPFSGAAMNPARWLGPALIGDGLDSNWPVWVLGPVVGALIASTLYELFVLASSEEETSTEDTLHPRAPEFLPPPAPEPDRTQDPAGDGNGSEAGDDQEEMPGEDPDEDDLEDAKE